MEKTLRGAFTLLELIVVVVIVSLLAVASFRGLQALKLRSFKVRQMTKLSLESQIVLDQLSALLHSRIPATTIGYDPYGKDFKPIQDIQNFAKYKILEWIGFDEDSFDAGLYSGFVDMRRSIKQFLDYSLYTDIAADLPGRALVFAGTFDKGFTSEQLLDAFGWHGRNSDLIYDILMQPPHTITITDPVKPKWLYEKYYLAKSAYGVARGADIDPYAKCLRGLDVDKNTLVLFYEYKPWRGESFCADPKSDNRSGQATILMRHVAGFGVKEQDFTLRLILDINKPILGQKIQIHFDKTKVFF